MILFLFLLAFYHQYQLSTISCRARTVFLFLASWLFCDVTLETEQTEECMPYNQSDKSLPCYKGVNLFLEELKHVTIIVYSNLYKNQINARALIGQSAVGYCYYKATEKSRVFRIII